MSKCTRNERRLWIKRNITQEIFTPRTTLQHTTTSITGTHTFSTTKTTHSQVPATMTVAKMQVPLVSRNRSHFTPKCMMPLMRKIQENRDMMHRVMLTLDMLLNQSPSSQPDSPTANTPGFAYPESVSLKEEGKKYRITYDNGTMLTIQRARCEGYITVEKKRMVNSSGTYVYRFVLKIHTSASVDWTFDDTESIARFIKRVHWVKLVCT